MLIHCTHGPEAPSQADRAFLIALAALEEQHEISMFLAGTAVSLLKDEYLDTVIGVRTGAPTLRTDFENILDQGGKIYVSEMSVESRGLTEEDLAGKRVTLASPNVLVQLTASHDRVITYG